ncbi:hypothetical protein GOP47_0017854 [Adiantum capillus-veneris]|uniref:Mediator of RNA polymerase II transcription subunit 32 n=1 Tax=Adiantum capillus-veneris TaxID=13818 RepID=A0A9D4UG71_ADICA|nr:hypothetical protein GOP47_0017854 [Adiantum capillus-veneris]
MEQTVQSLQNAFNLLLSSAATVLEAKEASDGLRTSRSDAALEAFIQNWQLFQVACDQAQEFIESIRQRIGSECLVDEATGSLAARTGNDGRPGLPPLSAVRLEQMSKAVRWLVIELQHGSSPSGVSPNQLSSSGGAAANDTRPSEDTAQ